MQKITTKKQRQLRTRKKMRATTDRLRLSVFRSNKYLSAQLIDDIAGKTLIGVHEKTMGDRSKIKIERAFAMGELLAQKAKELPSDEYGAKISEVVFDKGSYMYHGRVKAFAEGARKGGLIF